MSQMNLISQIKISIQKLKTQKLKSLLVVLPITILISVVIVATSEVFSITKAVEGSVFVALQNESKVIQLNKTGNNPGARILAQFGGNSAGSQEEYFTNADQDKIQAIDGVNTTQLVGTVPVRPVKIDSINGVSSIVVNNLSSLDAQSAKLYTTEDFSYTEGQTVIPIILSSNDLKETYSDWQGKTEIKVTLSTQRGVGANPGQAAADSNPVKTRAISYNPADLIGQVVTIDFGGLEKLQEYTQSFNQGSITFTKSSDVDMATKEQTRKDAISKYWNYEAISKTLQYQFKIVGITESNDQTRTFIPDNFSNKLISDYISNEKSARNSEELPEDQRTNFGGLVYDGSVLKYDQFAGLSAQINRNNTQAAQQNQEINRSQTERNFRPQFTQRATIGNQNQYFIPGLVYEQDSSTQNITGEYTGFTNNNYPLPAQTLLVSLKSSELRSGVVQKLNDAGYTFQDQNKLGVINELKNTLQNYIRTIISAVAAVVGLLVLFAMSRFVSDSRREIGIYRALGSTSATIRSLIVSQTMLLSVIGYLLGTLLGVGAVFAASDYMSHNIKSIINQIVSNRLPINQVFTRADFQYFDINQIGLILVILLILILIISLIPAQSAAKTSPIQAIRES